MSAVEALARPDAAPAGRDVPRDCTVIVIGAGINGAATFRDLCLQGVDCLLVDRSDICAGASAAPSRLIHGGIKYLEVGEFGLVAQSTLERNLLLRNAPHYVLPIETVLPLRSWFGGILPSIARFLGRDARMVDRGALVVRLGLLLFDWYGRRHRVLPRHRMHGRAERRRVFPDMDPGVVAYATYYDAKVTHAERLALELVLDGLAANPASQAFTYTGIDGVEPGEGGATRIVLSDSVTGARHAVAAALVINAAGGAIDLVNARLGSPTRHIGGQRGSHLVVANPRLHAALDGRMVYFGASDGRVALMYPFFGNVLIGATDIPVEADEEPICDEDETGYMLRLAAEIFPGVGLAREQVIFRYCGTRPLPRSDAAKPGAVSRDHSIRVDRLGGSAAANVPILSLIGGKWTTFRGFAEEATDQALAALGRTRRIGTRALAIGGGRDFPASDEARGRQIADIARRHGIDQSRAATLLERYGSRAEAVAEWCASRQDAPLATLPDYGRAEIGFIAANEHVVHAADIVFRRTDIALSGRLNGRVAPEVAAIAGGELGWDAARVAAEASAIAEAAQRRHGMRAGAFASNTA